MDAHRFRPVNVTNLNVFKLVTYWMGYFKKDYILYIYYAALTTSGVT